jgi:PIN domain nuclease of toxin-antitoxin system
MKFLLDTHVLLWAANEPGRLAPETRHILQEAGNTLLFSAASLWEIAIKSTLGRNDFQVDAKVFRRALMDNGYVELPITSAHAVAVDTLPSIHKDPFDRILVAQAIVEGITLLTADSQVASYPGPIRTIN